MQTKTDKAKGKQIQTLPLEDVLRALDSQIQISKGRSSYFGVLTPDALTEKIINATDHMSFSVDYDKLHLILQDAMSPKLSGKTNGGLLYMKQKIREMIKNAN